MPINRDHAFADGATYPRPGRFDRWRACSQWAQHWFPNIRAAQAWLQFEKQACISKNCLLGPDAWCVNGSGNIEAIKMEWGTICRGLLRIERFGSGRIVIGKGVYLGDDTLLSSAAGIEIGEFSLLAHGVQVFDNDSHPLDPGERESDYKAVLGQGERAVIASAPVKIGIRAWIGFNAIILKGVSIGDGAVVAAGSVVTRDVPPRSVAAGNPATIVKTL